MIYDKTVKNSVNGNHDLCFFYYSLAKIHLSLRSIGKGNIWRFVFYKSLISPSHTNFKFRELETYIDVLIKTCKTKGPNILLGKPHKLLLWIICHLCHGITIYSNFIKYCFEHPKHFCTNDIFYYHISSVRIQYIQP